MKKCLWQRGTSLTWNYTHDVWFYPWFKFFFQVIDIQYHTQKLRKIKFPQKIKFNHNIYITMKSLAIKTKHRCVWTSFLRDLLWLYSCKWRALSEERQSRANFLVQGNDTLGRLELAPPDLKFEMPNHISTLTAYPHKLTTTGDLLSVMILLSLAAAWTLTAKSLKGDRKTEGNGSTSEWWSRWTR